VMLVKSISVFISFVPLPLPSFFPLCHFFFFSVLNVSLLTQFLRKVLQNVKSIISTQQRGSIDIVTIRTRSYSGHFKGQEKKVK
jgi:hypothetical protein